MIELIERLFNLQMYYDIEASFSVFKSNDKTGLFIIIRLTKNGYRVLRCIEYKQWLEMSNMQRDFELSNMVRELNEHTEQDKEKNNA